MIISRKSLHYFHPIYRFFYLAIYGGAYSSNLISLCSSNSKLYSRSLKNVAYGHVQCENFKMRSSIKLIISKVRVGTSVEVVLESLKSDESICEIKLSKDLVLRLLNRFEDDWKSALGIFQWAGKQSSYEHSLEINDKMVDILGKGKQFDRMWCLLDEIDRGKYVTLNTISKVMRRLTGSKRSREAVRVFDELESFGLEKNSESMNLLLDALCKERRVKLAREIFVELKPHISPNAYTFNIFIHGWCNANKVEEATWTLQEMKGYGIRPCVISYSTIIQSYCKNCDFQKVYDILDEMESGGCSPNVVTYTTVMHSLAQEKMYDEALQIHMRMKLAGCQPDTLYYNCLIRILGRTGRVEEATRIFKAEMAVNGLAPNASTFNTMIAMYCSHSQKRDALQLLNQMENSTFCKPDLITYNPLLRLFVGARQLDSLLNDIVNKHHLSLDHSTYSLLIHGLCRANKCTKAYTIFEEMVSKGIKPRYVTCRLLLDKVKLKNMDDVADKVEVFMKHMKRSR